jgi:two-component system response regulator AtoC
MRSIEEKIARMSTTLVPVLISGESGTGKEVLARTIHAESSRRDGPFIKVNCAAIPAELMESELFGFEEGAFTGAYRNKPGMVELAQGGTLFLDEIDELDLHLQAKLLHVLQDGTFTHIGGRETLHADFRVMCATGKRLEELIAAGSFRADLYYRMNVVSLELPPLRDRRQDIPSIVQNLTSRYSAEYACTPAPLSPRLMELLSHHHWPGNIRELENLIRRYVIFGSEQAITDDLLHIRIGEPAAEPARGVRSLKATIRQAVRELERRVILEALQAHNWNRKEAARALQISYRSLFYKIKAAGLPQKRERAKPVQGNQEEKPC